jgi:CRISPR/Cas system-associated exonuclease Cas4 (RecB family)|tara:strand:- start:2049 stop:2951 length:903 start_codon:yes stop_codon:yes gene_type:complete
MNIDEKYNARIASMREFTYDWLVENYDDPSKPILKITKSSLGSYDWCPKKYDFSYIQRLPQDQTEAMRKGTILHNHRENFFNDFDIKKAESMNNSEILEYCTSLMPIDDYFDDSLTVASFEAQRFIEARDEGKINEFLPIVNEGKFDAEITIPKNYSKKYPLKRDYVIHIQGIIDRIFIENGKLIPFEYKTGQWKDYKSSSMRKEMAFYQLLIENAPEEVLAKNNLTKDMKVSHWGWYYPVSNYVFVEEIKTRSMTSVKDNIAKLINAYEKKEFPTKFFYKTCSHCSYFALCDAVEDTWL